MSIVNTIHSHFDILNLSLWFTIYFLEVYLNCFVLYRYYWERREPVNPDAPECYIIEQIEQGFQNDFQVMNSKNNHDRPVNEREYFDRPFSYMHQGFVFSPIHKRPVELS